MPKYYLHVYNGKYHFSTTALDGSVILENETISLIECFQGESFIDFEQVKFPVDIEADVLEIIGRLFFVMPNGIDGAQYIPSCFYPHLVDTEEVTIFGGSFNPWHEGHAECLRQCAEHEQNIVLVPDYSPWKNNLQSGPLASLLELSNHIDQRFPIYPGFWSKMDRNPTESWISEVRANKLNWLMGDDTFINFMKWDNVQRVVNRLSKIYVVPREHKNEDADELRLVHKQVLSINPELEIFYLKDHPFRGISSSGIREEI